MCTGFVKKGRDVIAGYNLDMGLGVWDYGMYIRKNMFYIGIKVGKTVYKTHGVNKNGNFANLPYMNGTPETALHRGAGYKRIDLLVNDFIAGKTSYNDILRDVRSKTIVNLPSLSMHSLISDASGHMLLVEPGSGYREIADSYAAVSNFPVISLPKNFSLPWYGRERYNTCEEILKNSGEDFSAADGIELLRKCVQTGEWATRVSFVYSRNENAVYYTYNGDFAHVMKHTFE